MSSEHSYFSFELLKLKNRDEMVARKRRMVLPAIRRLRLEGQPRCRPMKIAPRPTTSNMQVAGSGIV